MPLMAPGAGHLTERNGRCWTCLSKELATREVARRLEISEITVRRHLSTAMAKLGVDSRAAALDLLNLRDP